MTRIKVAVALGTCCALLFRLRIRHARHLHTTRYRHVSRICTNILWRTSGAPFEFSLRNPIRNTLLAAWVLTAACSGGGGGKSTADDPADLRSEETVVREVEVVAVHLVSGNFQSGFHGDGLAPLVVLALDADGSPVAGAEVIFTLRRGPGLSSADDIVLDPPEATTDAAGKASVSVILGTRSGSALVTAQDAGHNAVPVKFHLWSFHLPDESHRPLCILEFNDFHARFLPRNAGLLKLGGLARLAAIFKRVRTNNDAKGIATLIVNGGDDWENTLFHNEAGTISKLYRMYDEMGVDVVQVGNHDYHFGVAALDEVVAAAEPSFTGALQGHKLHFTWGNVDPTTLKDEYQAYVPMFETDFSDVDGSRRYNQTLLLEFAGLKVGVLGVATDASVYTQVAGDPLFYKMVGAPMEFSQGMTFFNPDPRESDYVSLGIDSLAGQGADVIVVASHAGLGHGDRVNIPPGKDEFIARHGVGVESGRAVDVILSAHSHVQLNHPIPENNPAGGTTWLVQAKEAGEFVAALALEVDVAADAVSLLDYHLIQVDQTLPEDEGVAAKVEVLKKIVEKNNGAVFQDVVGYNGFELSHRERAQSGLGQIIADAFLWGLKERGVEVDAGMVIPSIYRADLVGPEVTVSDVYDIVPLHNLDHTGIKDEPLVVWETREGLYDCSIFGLETTRMENVTIAEYILEAIYSLSDVLDQIMEGASGELSLDVFQFAGLSYRIDSAALPFQRMQRETVTVAGEPVDPQRRYFIAMVHSAGVNLAYIINTIVLATDPETGEKLTALVIQPDGKPYIDTEVAAWETVRDYLAAHLPGAPGGAAPPGAVVTGDRARSVEPDAAIGPGDISWFPANPVRGESVTLELTLRNFGEQAVADCTVEVYYDATPWDLTDNDDGLSLVEGFPASFTGSLVLIATETVSLASYPATTRLQVAWQIPEDLVPYEYPVVVRIEGVAGEMIMGNNEGPDQVRKVPVGR